MKLYKLVKENLKSTPKRYTFPLETIEEIEKISQKSKTGEDIYLLIQKKKSHENADSVQSLSKKYYIVSSNGEILGMIPTYVEKDNNTANIDFWIRPEHQNKGIGYISAQSVIKRIFINQDLDNSVVKLNKESQNTDIKRIELYININNPRSRTIARKLGFDCNDYDPTQFTLRKSNYLQKTQEQSEN